MFMPGASTLEDGTATLSVSGESIALWASFWKEQFLYALHISTNKWEMRC